MPSPAVLVVIDDPHLREIYVEFLSSENFLVIEAGDLPHAIRILKRDAIDLVVTDLYFGRRSEGVNIALAARKRRPALPVIFVFGGQNGIEPLALIERPCQYLQKPFRLEQLLCAIHDFIAR